MASHKPLFTNKKDEAIKEKGKEVILTLKSIPRPPPPFPQWLKNKAKGGNYQKFISMLKKRMMSFKLEDNVFYYSTIDSRSLVEKKEYSIDFIILCTIAYLSFVRALCNLGSSINLMTLFIYNQLGLGSPKPSVRDFWW